MAKHRIKFMQRINFLDDLFNGHAHIFGHFFLLGKLVRDEFMQWRVEQADRDRQPLHRFKNSEEIFFLHRQKFFQGFFPSGNIIGQDHFADSLDPVPFKEHMLGPAEADPFGAEIAGNF